MTYFYFGHFVKLYFWKTLEKYIFIYDVNLILAALL